MIRSGSSIRQAPIYQQHANLACPDGEHHYLFGYQDPLAPLDSVGLDLWSHLCCLLGRHVVGSASKYDSVDGYDKKRIPGNGRDHHPIIWTEFSDAQLASLRYTVDSCMVRLIHIIRLGEDAGTYSRTHIRNIPAA